MSEESLDRVEESGSAFFTGPGVKHASRPKKKDGDESVALGNIMGDNSAGWMQMLDDGSDNPYPTTVAALKSKNTRGNNDSFR